MGRNARLGVLCLMAMAIGLARLVEVELDPGAPPPALATAPPAPIEESPRVAPPPAPIVVRPPAPAPAPAAPQGERSYVVQDGDTLGTIARKVYGSSRHWKRILEANKDILPGPEKMRAGMRLRLPEPPRTP